MASQQKTRSRAFLALAFVLWGIGAIVFVAWHGFVPRFLAIILVLASVGLVVRPRTSSVEMPEVHAAREAWRLKPW